MAGKRLTDLVTFPPPDKPDHGADGRSSESPLSPSPSSPAANDPERDPIAFADLPSVAKNALGLAGIEPWGSDALGGVGGAGSASGDAPGAAAVAVATTTAAGSVVAAAVGGSSAAAPPVSIMAHFPFHVVTAYCLAKSDSSLPISNKTNRVYLQNKSTNRASRANRSRRTGLPALKFWKHIKDQNPYPWSFKQLSRSYNAVDCAYGKNRAGRGVARTHRESGQTLIDAWVRVRANEEPAFQRVEAEQAAGNEDEMDVDENEEGDEGDDDEGNEDEEMDDGNDDEDEDDGDDDGDYVEMDDENDSDYFE